MQRYSYSQLKDLLDDPNVDAKTQIDFPEMIRYVYFKFPRPQAQKNELDSVKTISAFRCIFITLLAAATHYEGHLHQVWVIFLFLALYEYGYTVKRLETVRAEFIGRVVEYDLRKRLLLSRLYPKEYAAEPDHPW